MKNTTNKLLLAGPVTVLDGATYAGDAQVDDVPAGARLLFRLNIVGDYVDMIRDVLLRGRLPDMGLYAATLLVSLVVFRFGYNFFMRYRAIFVDLI